MTVQASPEQPREWFCTFGLSQGRLRRRYVRCHGTQEQVGTEMNRTFGSYAFAYPIEELGRFRTEYPDYAELRLGSYPDGDL